MNLAQKEFYNGYENSNNRNGKNAYYSQVFHFEYSEKRVI